MEYHTVICRIAVMSVPDPVRRPHMDLDISAPFLTVDTYSGGREVGTRVIIVNSGTDNLYFTTIDSDDIFAKQTVFPEIVIKQLHKERLRRHILSHQQIYSKCLNQQNIGKTILICIYIQHFNYILKNVNFKYSVST